MMYRIVLRVLLSLAFAFWAGGSLQAADYVIVVDTSGSMTRSVSPSDSQNRITTVQNALQSWLQALPLGSRLTLVSFNSGIQSQREFIFRNKLDHQPALVWCDGIDEEAEAHKTGKTHLWTTLRKALEVATRYANENPGQTVQVRVFTDGQNTEENEDVPTFNEAVKGFPVDGKSIQGHLVILGDFKMDVKTQRDIGDHSGFRLRHDPNFEILLSPVVEWRPKGLRVGKEMIAYENSSSIYKTYSWSVNGQPVSTNKVLKHIFTTSGEHAIRLEVEGAQGGQEHSQVTIQVSDPYQPPSIRSEVLHWKPLNPSSMQSVRFYGRSLGHPVAYKWEIDDEIKGRELDFEWKFASEGEFSVVFSAQNENGKWFPSDPQTLIVREPSAIVNFRANPKTYHHNQVVQFANESQGNFVSFRWDFGDGQTSAERSPQHQYENDGDDPKTFRVQLVGKLSNGQEIRSKIHSLTILPSPPTLFIPPPPIPPPQAAIGLDSPSKIGVGQTVRFLDESIGLIQSWRWNFNDESSSMERHPEFTFQTPGDKTITLIVQGDGEEQSSASLLIAISPEPPKGWLQRFWWILIPAIFLLFVSAKFWGKIRKARNAPPVPPNKKMRVEISEVSKSKKDNKPNAGQNLKPLKTFVLEMQDKIYLSQTDATNDGAGDEFVCDIPAKGCYFQRHSHLGFFSPGNDGKPHWLKFSDSVEITDDFGAKRTLTIDISEEIIPETF